MLYSEWPMVQVYHGYKKVFLENFSEDIELHEAQKTRDTHAVAIKKSIVREYHTVEHISRKSSSVFSIFIVCMEVGFIAQ